MNSAEKRTNPLLLILTGVLLVLLLWVIFYSRNASQKSLKSIGSLNQVNTIYSDQIDSLTLQTNSLQGDFDSLQEEILMLQAQTFLGDSLIEGYKAENIRTRLFLAKSMKNDEQRSIWEEKEQLYLSQIEEKNNTISKQRKLIELLRSRHDIPIVFLLACSLQFYSSDSLADIRFSDEFDRIARINGWQETCKQVTTLIDNFSKSHYRTIKWASQKAGIPYSTSYFFIKENGYDPKTIKKDEFFLILNEAFRNHPREFKYCSNHIRKSFTSEIATLSRINGAITCLRERLGIKS